MLKKTGCGSEAGRGRRLAALLLVALGGATDAAAQMPAPAPPCGNLPWPAPAALAASPEVAVWREKDLNSLDWRPPSCTGWQAATPTRLLVAISGRFTHSGDSDALLARVGAVSALESVRYWSVSEKAWRPLVLEAAALAGPAPTAARRGDFASRELADGQPRYYVMHDRRSGAVVYRLRVLEHSVRHLVVVQENLSPVRVFGKTLFGPKALQTSLFLHRETDASSTWQLYVLSRMDRQTSSFLTGGHEASFANRALAVFRSLAGIPTDQEPPAVR